MMDDKKFKRQDEIYREQRAEVDKREDHKDFLNDKSTGGGPNMMRPTDDYIERSLGKQTDAMERHDMAAERTDKQFAQEERVEARQQEIKDSIDKHRGSLGLEPNKEQSQPEKAQEPQEKAPQQTNSNVDKAFNDKAREGQAEKELIRNTVNNQQSSDKPKEAFNDKSLDGELDRQERQEAVQAITSKLPEKDVSNDNVKETDEKAKGDKDRRMERARAMMDRQAQERERGGRER